MTPAERLKEIEEKWTNPKYEYEGEHIILDNANWLIARVKKLTEALEISLYTMRGSTSQLDLTVSREMANYIEICKGAKIAFNALEDIS